MALGPTIMEELKAAMKAKDTVARDTLRMLKAQLGEAELAKGAPLGETDEIAVLTRAVKTRTESAAQYDEGGRADLAEKERAEIAIVQRFLPKALSEDEAKEAIAKLAAEGGFSEKKQMGQLMKAVKAAFPGQIDGRLAAKIAGQLLR
ncbi:MAG: GatB/YqeY domain-containing protein [Myxococcota bacterium]